MLLKALVKCGVQQQARFERKLFQSTLEKIQRELDGIETEKNFIEHEDSIRQLIKDRINFGLNMSGEAERPAGVARPFRPTFTKADEKLSQEMPRRTTAEP
jgi:hypothetical protein